MVTTSQTASNFNPYNLHWWASSPLNTHSLIGLCNTWTWNLTLMHHWSLLDCLQPAALLFQQVSGWLKSPIRMRAHEGDASWSWGQEVPPGQTSAVDPIHEVSFVGVVPDFYPQAPAVRGCFPEAALHNPLTESAALLLLPNPSLLKSL